MKMSLTSNERKPQFTSREYLHDRYDCIQCNVQICAGLLACPKLKHCHTCKAMSLHARELHNKKILAKAAAAKK